MAVNNGLDIQFYDDPVFQEQVGLFIKMTNSTASVSITLPNGNIYTQPETTYAYIAVNIPEITLETGMPTGVYTFAVTDVDGDTSTTTFNYTGITEPTFNVTTDVNCVLSELVVQEKTNFQITYSGTDINATFVNPLLFAVTHQSGDNINCGSTKFEIADPIATDEAQTISPICIGAYNILVDTYDAFYPIQIETATGSTITTATDIQLYIGLNTNINQVIVDCNAKLCSFLCCIKSLYKKYNQFIEEGNKELMDEYYDKLMRAMQITRLAKRALLCQKSSDFESYSMQIGEITECMDCLNC